VKYEVCNNPIYATVHDFNNDTKLDLTVANYQDASVSVLLGNGDGTFQNQVTHPTGSHPSSVVSADLNNDTKWDLAVTNKDESSVSILLGNGDGTFQNQIRYGAGISPSSVIVGVLNDDTKLDLAVTNLANNNVITLFTLVRSLFRYWEIVEKMSIYRIIMVEI
jgi:hypothetical protein